MSKSMNDTATMPMTKNQALAWLVEQAPVTVTGYPELAKVFGWQRTKCWRVIGQWRRRGWVETDTAPDTGRLTVSVIPNAIPIAVSDGFDDDDEDDGTSTFREGTSSLPDVTEGRSQRAVRPANEQSVPSERTPSEPAVYATYVDRPHDIHPVHREAMTALDVLAVLAAIFLTGICAVLSVRGMIVLFPGIPMGAGCLGAGIEACKLTAAAWIGHRWRFIGWPGRLALIALVASAAALNAVGVYGQLVEGHVGPRGQAAAGLETGDAGAAAKIEVAQGRLADIDRRLGQIDGAVEAASRRGAAKTSVSLIRQQQRDRAALAGERERAAKEVADLKAERAGAAAKGHAVEAEALPIQYVAELFGITRDGEEVIRWFIAGLVGCGDPFAIILLGVVMGRRRRAA
jgi:hypothetical protein